jgi:hypothetical protein
VIFEPGKTFISQRILHQHWYTCPVAFSVRRNPQHRSLLTVVSATSAVVYRFTWQTLPTVNRKHFCMNILCIESFWPENTHNRTLLFVSTLLKHGRHFDYWNHPLNMSMCVCYLDFFLLWKKVKYKNGLGNPNPALSWRWTVLLPSDIHRKLLRPLRLVHFHLCPIYWLYYKLNPLMYPHCLELKCDNPRTVKCSGCPYLIRIPGSILPFHCLKRSSR